MVILTCTVISVLYGKIRNKFKNMVLFYHIRKRKGGFITEFLLKGMNLKMKSLK